MKWNFCKSTGLLIVLYRKCSTSQQDSIPDIHKDVCSNSTVLKTYVVCIKESDQEGKASRKCE